ncbi:hypothetical protein KJZ63_01645 [Patescibacteria group bacterium]|nr:hypothetical protein [Patescibacteria group bacterium]
MSIKRTRKQKQQAEMRHESVLTYSLKDIGDGQKTKEVVLQKQKAEAQQLKEIFDPSFIKKDLLKTFLVTALVSGVLIAYTFYQR